MTAPSDEGFPFAAPTAAEQERMVEAVLFASAGPLSANEIEARLPRGSDVGEALRRLESQYRQRGVTLVRVAGKWSFRTASDLSFLLRQETIETKKLSRAATETLAIIAYHQPVTRTEIEEVRGVAVSKGTLDLLLDLDWVRFGPRRATPGRPVTFMTTDEFLEHFGLDSVRDLPGLDELKRAGLLDTAAAAIIPGANEDDDDGEEDDAEQSKLL